MTNNHAKVILNALCAGISNLETLEAITMAIKALDEMHQDLITAEEYAFSLKEQLAEKNAEIKRLKTLAELGNMRANDYRVMRDRALKAEAEVERLKEEVSFGQRTCREWAESCDELTEKLNGAIAGQETLQKALAEKIAEIERLREEKAKFDNTILYNLEQVNKIVEKAKAELAEDFEEEFFVGGVTYSITKEEFDEFIKRKAGEG